MRFSWAFILLVFWPIVLGPGSIEGAWFPAAKPAKILDVYVDPDNPEWVVISGKSERLRPSCNPRRLEWYRGQRGERNTTVDWDWGPPKVRHDGAFTFTNWRVRAAPEDVFREETFADVLHQCELIPGIGNPWLTKSRFWR